MITPLHDVLKLRTAGGEFTLQFQPHGEWESVEPGVFRCPAGEYEWTAETGKGLRIRCRHTGSELPDRSPECTVIPGEKGSRRMLIHHPVFGGSRSGISKTEPGDDFFGAHEFPQSPLFTLLYDRERKHGVFGGFQVPVRDDSLFLYENGKLICRFWQTAPPATGITSDTLLLDFGPDPVELLKQYAGTMPQLKEELKAKVITGWNSWDYYFQTVTEEDVEENLEALKRCPEIGGKIEYIILDDGWQNGYGDWEVSSRFHDDLKGIVEKIHSAGCKAGIWVAPFIADYYSKLSLRHPEMLARNAEGNYDFAPGGNGGIGTVDPTHPEAEKMLRELFTRLRKLGFEYFKVDFVRYLMAQSRFHDRVRRIDMVTRGMRIIREAIGPDALLTGCGMPLYGGYGIADCMRIAEDISTFWSNVLSSARSIAATFFLHRKAWINDSDFLLVRNPLTTDEEPYNPFFLPKPYRPFESRSGKAIQTLNETQVWCSLVLLSGGNVILGDNFARLNGIGKKLIETVLDYVSADCAEPLDLFDSGIPAVWRRQGKDRTLYAFFNWEDQVRDFDFPVSAASGREIWTGEKRSFPDRRFREALLPHSVRVIEMN